jgi:FecR protein
MMKRTIFLVSFLVLGLMNASAQYLVSTKAGFVNRADGKVYIQRVDSEDGQPGRASLGTQMRDGDRLKTESDSRAEILLSPGSYLRLDQNTEVRAVSTEFMQMTFELVRGSMIVEVGIDPQPIGAFVASARQTVTKKTPLEIITPQGTFFAAKDTLVRIDAKTAATWIAVRQGEIRLGTRDMVAANQGEKVKRGKLVRLTGSDKPELAKVDKDQIDNFDSWSFVRAQTLVQANLSSLRQNRTLAQGGWYYNSFFGCYSFVPYRGYLVSPYGFGFFRNYADCLWYDPFYGGYRGYGYGYYNGNNNGGGGVTTPNAPARVIAGVDREPIRREIPAERTINFPDNSSRGDFGMGSRGISNSSSSTATTSSAPATISSPAPTRSDSGGSSAPMPTRGGNNN